MVAWDTPDLAERMAAVVWEKRPGRPRDVHTPHDPARKRAELERIAARMRDRAQVQGRRREAGGAS